MVRKNIKSRIAAATAAFILIAGLLSIANEFMGNPVSAYFATKDIQRYVEEKYPEFNLKVEKVKYNKFAVYSSNIVSPTEPDLHFQVIRRRDKTIYDSYEGDVLLGYNTHRRFSQELTEEIETLLTAKYGEKLGGRCSAQFDTMSFNELFRKGVVKLNQPYSKDFQCSIRMFVNLKIDPATPENIAQHIIEVNSFLEEQGYSVDTLLGVYTDNTKEGYSVSVDKDYIEEENLAKRIQKAIDDRNSVHWEKISVYPHKRYER